MSIKPRRLGHIVLSVADIRASVAFYTSVLGLKVSDWIGDHMVFLRAGTDHHDLALAQIPQADPDGNNVEIDAEMQQIALDEPHEPRVWERNVESFDRWRFAKFVVAPPAAVVQSKSGSN